MVVPTLARRVIPNQSEKETDTPAKTYDNRGRISKIGSKSESHSKNRVEIVISMVSKTLSRVVLDGGAVASLLFRYYSSRRFKYLLYEPFYHGSLTYLVLTAYCFGITLLPLPYESWI